MLYQTLGQPFVFLIIFAAGFIAGGFFDLSALLSFLSGKDKYSKNIFDFFAVVISFALLYFANLIFNYGLFRFYVLFLFLIALAFERFLSKLWTKAIQKCYNKHKNYGNKEKKHS